MATSISPAAISDRTRLEETISPSTSTSGTTRASNSSREASISGSPFAFAPKRKFSPTETFSAPSVSTRIRRQKSSAGMVENSRLNGMTTSSSTRRPSMTSRLISNGMMSFGVASG